MNTLNSSVNTEKSLEILSQTKVLEKDFTVYGTAEEPLFLAKDVAAMIEHSNVTKMLESIDDDEKVKIRPNKKLGLLTSNNSYNFLTENGLYEVLMQSTKPIAKSFKKQIKKILHDLRTGKTVIAERKVIDEFEHIEARVEAAKMLREIGLEYNGKSKNFKQIIDAHVTKTLTGSFIVPLPEVTRQTYSATEIGEKLGISANKVGAIAIKYGLKTDEYGEWVHDKSRYSSKEVDTFRYFDSVIPAIKENLLDVTPKKIESAAEKWIEKEVK